jgi:hypothetical protein
MKFGLHLIKIRGKTKNSSAIDNESSFVLFAIFESLGILKQNISIFVDVLPFLQPFPHELNRVGWHHY